MPFPSAGDLPNSGIKPASLMFPALACGFFTTSSTCAWVDFCTKKVLRFLCHKTEERPGRMEAEPEAEMMPYRFGLQYPPAGLPWWLSWLRVHLQCGRPGFDPWVGKIPWRKAWQPTPVFLPGESPWTEDPGGLQSMGSQIRGVALMVKSTWLSGKQGRRDSSK